MTTVGVLGAGQLGQMLGYAGRSLDLEFVFLDPAADPPAGITGRLIQQPFDSIEGLTALAARSDIVTFEFENVPATSVEFLAGKVPVFPPAEALRQAQDRLLEKRLFGRLGIPVPDYRAVDSKQDLKRAIETIGLPLVLKTRREGYDGKGQEVVRCDNDADAAWRRLGGTPLIAERRIAFDREVSAIGARRRNGEIALFPLVENEHRDGVLRVSRAPAVGDALERTAHRYLRGLLDGLDYVGVLALELFVVGDRLLANEIAPRVHNSGHWTIEGAHTSQFENHLRAILDLPLGDAGATGHAGMINLLGSIPDDIDALTAAGFRVHVYGKTPRPGRKLGHMTTVANSPEGRDRRVSEALKIVGN